MGASNNGKKKGPRRGVNAVPATSSTSPAVIENMTEVERKALELRKSGATYDQIRKSLGMKSLSGAHDAVKRAMRKIIEEPAQEVLKMELERLDQMYMISFSALQKSVALSEGHEPDFGAMDRCLRIIAQRTSLLGIDQPAQVSVNVHNNVVQIADNTQDYLKQLRELREAEEEAERSGSETIDAEIVEELDG